MSCLFCLNWILQLNKLKCVIFLGAIAAFTISKVNCNWYSMGDFFFAVGSLVACGVLLCCVYCKNLYLIYIFYIVYGMMYQTMLTIAEWVYILLNRVTFKRKINLEFKNTNLPFILITYQFNYRVFKTFIPYHEFHY